MKLALLQWNNYSDRLYKKFDTLAEYAPYIIDYSRSVQTGEISDTVNYDPLDGISAMASVQMWGSAWNISTFPNYCIYVDGNNIVSRWFIVESNRENGGGYTLQLRRDVLADFETQEWSWRNAPAYIERAVVNSNSPFVFNKEPLTYNQIKKAEYLIKDRTKDAWLVAYIARNTETQTISGKINNIIARTYTRIADFPYAGTKSCVGRVTEANTRVRLANTNVNYNLTYSYENNSFSTSTFGGDANTSKLVSNSVPTVSMSQNLYGTLNVISLEQKINAEKPTGDLTEVQLEDLRGLIGNYILDTTTQKTYVVTGTITPTTSTTTARNNGTLQNAVLDAGEDIGLTVVDRISSRPNTFAYSYEVTQTNITLQEVTVTSYNYSFTLPAEGTRNTLIDAPYDLLFSRYDPEEEDSNLLLDLYQSMATTLDASCYDIQLLPFCPVLSDTELDVSFLTEQRDYVKIKQGSADTGKYVYFATYSKGSFSITDTSFGLNSTVGNVKVESETQFYRICSPSYSSTYEYSNAKNRGSFLFTIDFLYKPFNPYIHICPAFKGIYGTTFRDSRGLICTGDFSLARITDAWVNYELQNKNYQAIFSREIKSLDLQNSIGLAQDIVGATVGTFQGAMTGGYISNNLMGKFGMGAGVGATLSAIGGVTDIGLNEWLRQDNRDKVISLRNMQLQNIQALPYSLSRTDSFTPNNKIFPVLEVFDCTDEEKLNLARYISFNSMTVNQYATVAEYEGNTWSYEGIETRGFIKAQLLLSEYSNSMFNGETHEWRAIAEELEKGVYIN